VAIEVVREMISMIVGFGQKAVTCGIAVLLIVACSGPSSQRKDLDGTNREYSNRHYIKAYGESQAGQQEAAEQRARDRVAQQISSEILSEVKIESGTIDRDNDYQKILSTVKQTSKFDHAELIRIVSKSSSCNRAGCRALAVLKRAEAVSILSEEYQRLATTFRETVSSAVNTTDPVRFTAPYRQAEGLFLVLSADAYQIKVIGKRHFAAFKGPDGDDALFRKLLSVRGRLTASLNITVLPGTVKPSRFRSRLVNAIVGAFSNIGLRSSAGAVCVTGLAFEPEAVVDCRSGHFGPVCSLDLKGSFRDCVREIEITPVDLRPKNIRGAHPRDPEAAQEQVFRKTTPGALAPLLNKQLHDVLPIL